MALILTFLGKGGVGCTTVAIAAGKKFAQQGSRVLLVSQDPSPALGLRLGVTVTPEPQTIGANFSVMHLATTALLDGGWEEVKQLEAEYLRSPTLKNVYGQELAVLPGMDEAFALKTLQEHYTSQNYDVIIYDGPHNLQTLRMLGTIENMSWYGRRFQEVFQQSDIGRAISPFVQPVTGAIFNVSWNPDNFAAEPTNKATEMMAEGRKIIADPQRLAAYVVTTNDPIAITTGQYLWGSAQQVGVTVGGVIYNQGSPDSEAFSPLPTAQLPTAQPDDWQSLIDALPDFTTAAQAPKPIEFDTLERKVKVFLPSFDKKQVKLTQYGTEITIEAGDQRRNIQLPPPLKGRSVQGAKFQGSYLVISL